MMVSANLNVAHVLICMFAQFVYCEWAKYLRIRTFASTCQSGGIKTEDMRERYAHSTLSGIIINDAQASSVNYLMLFG